MKLNKNQIDFLQEIIKDAESLIPNELELNTARDENCIRLMRIFYLLKYIKTLRAFILLVENDYNEDAIILLRTLCEIWIKYLHAEKNIPLSSFLFLRQMGIHDLKNLGNLRKTLGGALPDDFDYMSQECEYENYIQFLIEKIESHNPELGKEMREDFKSFSGINVPKNRNKYWVDKTLYDLLKEVSSNISWVYPLGFEMPSELLHSNPSTVGRYLDIDDTKATPKWHSDGLNLEHFSMFAAGWLIAILEEYCRAESIKPQFLLTSLDTQLLEVFPIRKQS